MVSDSDVAKLANFFVDISDLCAQLSDVAEHQNLRLLDFGVNSQHTADREGTSLA